MAQVKGIKIQTAGAWLSLVCGALSLVTGIYYAVAAGATNNFTATVLVCFLLGAVCALTYSLVPSDWGDILNLVAVVFLAVAILEFIVSSIATLADVLSGITMFGSTGGIEYIVITIGLGTVALVVEIASCFMRRTK